MNMVKSFKSKQNVQWEPLWSSCGRCQYSGFLPRSKGLHIRSIVNSKCRCECECACVCVGPAIDWGLVQSVPNPKIARIGSRDK